MSEAAFDRSIAAVVGINDYRDDIPRLDNAVRDALGLAKRLKRDHQYEIRALVKRVTPERFRCFLRRLRAEVRSEDRVIFYFAGHGIAPDIKLGRPGSFVLQNARRIDDSKGLLSMDEVKRHLDDLKCRHLLVVLDCCYAGNFRLASTHRHGEILPTKLYSDHYLRYVEHPARQVLTASAHDQKVHDRLGDRGKGEHSPFAAALLEALTGAADISPKGGDGVITATELSQYMRDHVELATMTARYRQTPELWNLEGHDKGQYVFEVPGRKAELKPAPDLTEELNPYLPWQPLEVSQDELLFGRKQLAKSIAEQLDRERLTVLAGAPAVGTSSLLRAGVLAALKPEWRVVGPLKPGPKPAAELDAALEAADIRDPAAAAVWLNGNSKRHLVIAIDPWDELQSAPSERREAFLQKIAAWENSGLKKLRWLIAVHAEAQSHSELPGTSIWGEISSASWIEIPAMDPDQLQQVVVGPALQRALVVEEALAASLVEEMYKTPAALPLLILVMHRLFCHYLDSGRDDRRLRLADYTEAAGGLAGCLQPGVDLIVEDLDDSGRDRLDRILLRLADIRDGRWIGRPASWADLETSSAATNLKVRETLELMKAQRLIVGQGDRIVASHDEVIRIWKDRWSEELLDDVALQRDVSAASAAWETKQRGSWWADRRLRQLQRDRQPKSWLSQRELEFLATSRRIRWRAQIALSLFFALFLVVAKVGYDALGTGAELGRRSLTQSVIDRVAPQITAGELHRALLLARQAWNLDEEGKARPAVDRVLRLALEVTPESEVLRLGYPSGLASSVSFRPNSTELAIVDGSDVLLLEPQTSESVRRLRHGDNVNAITWSADGRWLAIAYSDGWLRIWDSQRPESFGTSIFSMNLSQDYGSAQELAFVGSTDRLALRHEFSQPHHVSLWRVTDEGLKHEVGWDIDAALQSMASDPLGRSLWIGSHASHFYRLDVYEAGLPELREVQVEQAIEPEALAHGRGLIAAGSGTDQGIQLAVWRSEALDLGLVATVTIAAEPSDWVKDLEWVPGEESLAVTLNSGRWALWPLGRGGQPALRPVLAEHAEDLSFRHDGELLAISEWSSPSGLSAVRLWRRPAETWHLRDSASRHGFRAPNGGVLSLAQHPIEPQLLAIGGGGGEVRVWDRAAEMEYPLAGRHYDWVESLAYLPDGSSLISASGAGRANWHSPDGKRSPPSFPSLQSRRVAVGADGRWVASLDKSGDFDIVRFYLLEALGTPEPQVETWEDTGGNWVLDLAMHPHRELAVGAGFGLGLWRRGAEPGGEWRFQSLNDPGPSIHDLEFSPDGQRLAVGTMEEGRNVAWWSVEALDGPANYLEGADGPILKVTFSPDGTSLAAAGSEGKVYLWSLDEPTRPRVLLGHRNQLYALAFSLDGTQLATGGLDSEGYIWRVDVDQLAHVACQAASANLTWDEWSQYVGPQVAYELTCPGLPLHPSLIEAGDELSRQGEWFRALKIYRRADELDPQQALHPIDRYRSWRKIKKVEEALEEERFDDALQELDKVHEMRQGDLIDADTWDDLCRRGALHSASEQVLQACHRAISLAPYDGDFYESRAIAYIMLSRFPEAIRDLSIYIEKAGAPEITRRAERWIQRLEQEQNPLEQEIDRVLAAEPSREVTL